MSKAEREKERLRKERNHERYVERTYALAPGEYKALLKRQGGRCAICRKVPRKRNLAVDHDHSTGKVRGLLCYMCNSALGVFEFDRVTAYRASDYIRQIAEDMPDPLVEPGSTTMRVSDDLPF